jgi:hypothetical protein
MSGWYPVIHDGCVPLAATTHIFRRANLYPLGQSNSTLKATFRVWMRSCGASSRFRFTLPTFLGQTGPNGELNIPQAIRATAAIEDMGSTINAQDGLRYQVAWNGVPYCTLVPGQPAPEPDMPYPLTSGKEFFLRICLGGSVSTDMLPVIGVLSGADPSSTTGQAFGRGEGFGYGDVTMCGDIDHFIDFTGYGPYVGEGWMDTQPASLLALGDSVSAGNIALGGAKGNSYDGFPRRFAANQFGQTKLFEASVWDPAILPRMPFCQMSVPGASTLQFLADHDGRDPLISKFHSVVTNFGTNDLTTGATNLARYKTNFVTFLLWLTQTMGKRVIVYPPMPDTDTTDGGRSLAGQTPNTQKTNLAPGKEWQRDPMGMVRDFTYRGGDPSKLLYYDSAARIEVDRNGNPKLNGGYWPVPEEGDLDLFALTADAGPTTLTCATKDWEPHRWKGCMVYCVSGSNVGAMGHINNNSETVLSLTGNPMAACQSGDEVVIYRPWGIGPHGTERTYAMLAHGLGDFDW